MPKSAVKKMREPNLPPELVEVENANLIVSRQYVPRPYPGTVILFQASEQPWEIYSDPKLGWGDLGIKTLVIHEVPGHHGSILFEPRVGKMAAILKGLLE